MKTLLIVPILSITLSVFGFALSAPQKSKPLIIDGSQTPELIPTFLAWKMFLVSLDQGYQYDVLDTYLVQRVKLAEIEGYQS